MLILIDVTEDLVKSVTKKLSGSLGPRGKNYKALQGWILRFGEDSEKIRTRYEMLIGWLDNHNPSWEAYRVFMSGQPIELYKQTDVWPLDISETWRHIFYKCILRIMIVEATTY